MIPGVESLFAVFIDRFLYSPMPGPLPQSPIFRSQDAIEVASFKDDPELFQLLRWKPWDEDERKKFNIESLRKHIQSHPEGVGIKYEFQAPGRGYQKRYPLQRAIALGATLDVIEQMYTIYPPAMQDSSSPFSRSTPLHSACAYQASFDVIKFCLQKFPEAAHMQTKYGYTPLHNACEYGKPCIDVIQLLIKANKQALTIRNRLGKTPYETAANNPNIDPTILEVLRNEQQSVAESPPVETEDTETAGEISSSIEFGPD